MNREDELNKTFPLKDGTTYIQNLDKHFNVKNKGMKRKLSTDDVWLWITYAVMALSICVLMVEVLSLKSEIRHLKEIKAK